MFLKVTALSAAFVACSCFNFWWWFIIEFFVPLKKRFHYFLGDDESFFKVIFRKHFEVSMEIINRIINYFTFNSSCTLSLRPQRNQIWWFEKLILSFESNFLFFFELLLLFHVIVFHVLKVEDCLLDIIDRVRSISMGLFLSFWGWAVFLNFWRKYWKTVLVRVLVVW